MKLKSVIFAGWLDGALQVAYNAVMSVWEISAFGKLSLALLIAMWIGGHLDALRLLDARREMQAACRAKAASIEVRR